MSVSSVCTHRLRMSARRALEQRREGCELALEMCPVAANLCDETEVVKLEARPDAATHQGKGSQTPRRLPHALLNHCNALVLLPRSAKLGSDESAHIRIIGK